MSKKNTLVIVPGWGGTKETWQKFIAIAEYKYQVVCFELPCFGNQPCPNEVWGVEDYANFLQRKLLELNLAADEIVLLGHSFGGVVVAHLAASNPDICRKLIISGAPIIRKKQGISKAIIWTAAKLGKLVFKLPFIEKFDLYAKKALYKVINSDYNESSGIQKEIFKKIISEDQTHLLPSIKLPTLVIFGDKDTYVDPEDGRKIAAMIPDAKLRIVEGGKHGLHIQQPEKLLEIILEFTGISL